MFGLAEVTELFQGSTERTWNRVLHIIHTLWNKFNSINQPIMPKTRKRHHSRSRSRSYSREHRKVGSHDRDGKRRRVDSESPNYRRSVSCEPEDYWKTTVVDRIEDLQSPDISLVFKKSENVEQTNDQSESKCTEITSKNEDNTKTLADINNDKPESQTVSENQKSKNNVLEQSMEVDSVIVSENELDKTDIITDTSLNTSVKENESITLPKKPLTPKQIRRRNELEMKRQQKLKEKEEQEKKKKEEKERIHQEKQKKKEEKQREKEQKEEQRRKEKEEKEEQRKKEKEEKEEQRRREREEKEEQRKKEKEERELEKLKKLEEKIMEKQKEEEKKQKTVAAFVNFFVKKSDNSQEDRKSCGGGGGGNTNNHCSYFMDFEIKSDMRLPPMRRQPLTNVEIENIDKHLQDQHELKLYLPELKSGKTVGTCRKTWPHEEECVVLVEDNLGETIDEDKSIIQKFRAKFLKFHDNRRPPYYGTWRKKSKCIKARRPFVEDNNIFNYEEDSDDDWEEEEQGESLDSEDEADKENEDEKDDYEVDNDFFVPHGHLSDDEVDDEEKAKLSPESLKQKLKLLKDEFEHDMQLKTHKLKPRYIGCIWQNIDLSIMDEPVGKYLQSVTVIANDEIFIKKRSENKLLSYNRKPKSNHDVKTLSDEYIPLFLKHVHLSQKNKKDLAQSFIVQVANEGKNINMSENALKRYLKSVAVWKKSPLNGPKENKYCWVVSSEDTAKKYDVAFI